MATTHLQDKRRQAGALMAKAGCLTHKEDVLSPYGVERIRDLTEKQLDDLCAQLSTVIKNKETVPAEIRKARSNVLSLCDDLGIKPKKGNWDSVNKFLKNPRIAGKPLYEMDLEELKACAKRIRAMKQKVDERIEQEKLWAQNN